MGLPLQVALFISEVRKRYKELQELSYSLIDHVGKAGIEAKFEPDVNFRINMAKAHNRKRLL